MLSRGTYEAVVANLADKKTHERQSESLRSVASKFPNVPHDTLYSIHAQQIQQATKQHYSYHKKPPVTRSYYERYLASSDDPEILLQISNDISLSPALLSRLILESYIAEHSIAAYSVLFWSYDNNLKRCVLCCVLTAARSPSTAIVSQWMKEPQLIPNKQLQQQVVTCILNDANYGLLAENIKSSVGYQYEQKLRRILEERKIPFLDEEFMRSHGYDKTPDFKIHVPFAVGGTVVNWIESKALFANEASHKRYCEEQLLSYYNRFGSGLVIYWFGFVEEICHGSETQGILIRNCFPEAHEMTIIELV